MSWFNDLLEEHKVPTFAPRYSDEQWDAVRKSIRENKKDLDREIIGFALGFMAKNPNLAPLVPFLSREYESNVGSDLAGLIGLVEGILGSNETVFVSQRESGAGNKITQETC